MKPIFVFFSLALVFVISCSESDNDKDPYVTTVVDVGGSPDGVTVAESGNIYITDISSAEIKQITPNGSVTTLDGITAMHPDGITAVTENGYDILYVADTGSTDPEDAVFSDDGTVLKIQVDLDTGDALQSVFVDSTVLDNPTGIAVDHSGNLYVADQGTGDVYQIPIVSETAQTPESLTGTGTAVDEPHGLDLVENDDGSVTLYATDQGGSSNNVVKIDIPASGDASLAEVNDLTLESTGGSESGTIYTATFDNPHGVSVGSNGAVFVTDENNNRVQIITPAGNVITFAGSGTSGDSDGNAADAQFNQPRGICVDSDGDVLVCDYGNGKVKKIVP